MPQLLRFILLIAVIAALGYGVYHWMEDEKGGREMPQSSGAAGQLEQP